MLFTKLKKETSFVSLDAKSDPKLTNVIQMLLKNENVQNFAHCAAEKETGGAKEFLDAMRELVDIIEKRIYTSSIDQNNYEKSLGQLWKANNLHKVRIAGKSSSVREQLVLKRYLQIDSRPFKTWRRTWTRRLKTAKNR